MSDPSTLSTSTPRTHFSPFTEGFRPWLVLGRNAIPVIGVYALGWSSGVVILQIWFDGVTALGAMIAYQMSAFVKRDNKTFKVPAGVPANILPVILVVVWMILYGVLGIPYWFTMFFFNVALFESGFWNLLFREPMIVFFLMLVLVSNTGEEWKRGYEQMSDEKIRLEFNWQFSMHLARIAAMILVSFFLRGGLIIPIALALSYVEIYPMRTLRLFGGDKTLEPGNENRSKD